MKQTPTYYDPPLKPGHKDYIEDPNLEKGVCGDMNEGWFCTLAKGHEGDHAAHGIGMIARWPK